MVTSLESWWEVLRRRAEAAQSLIEYALITALVSLAALVVVAAMGSGVAGVFTRITTRLAGVG
jgi:Flp pilus assembly pilin Flp